MFPQLKVYLDDATQPKVLETISMDFWTYEEIVAKDPRAKTSEHGMRLTVAFIHCEGRDPKNLEEVKIWARAHKVRVIVGDTADPTQPGPGDGS